MKTFTLRSQFLFQNHTKLITPTASPQHLIHLKTTSHKKSPTTLIPKQIRASKQSPTHKPLILEDASQKSQQIWKEELSQVSPNGYSRFVILGAVTVGFVLFVMGADEQRALAFGPEGPLVEEFWDNMRRYGLYILTVSTGVASAIFEPILELMKNPISAILVLIILGGGIFITSQVLSAMVGVSEFNYEYSY